MSRQPGNTMTKHKALSTLFRALDAHTYNDKARLRPHLHHVRAWRVPAPTAALFDETGPVAFVDDLTAAPDSIRFEATNGLCLVRVDVPAAWFDDVGFAAPDGYYVGKAAATLLSVGSAPVPNPDASDEWQWPYTDQVIPSETLSPGAAAAYNPVLLGGVLETLAKIAAAFDANKADPVRIQMGQSAVEPCRITRKIVTEAGTIDVTAAVMPCRL